MAKPEKRREARRLRAVGWSLRRIAGELDVALSSVSVWVRDVDKPETSTAAAVVTDVPAPPGPIGRKRCGRCRADLPLSSFNRDGDGHQWWCRDCFRAYFRARGELHIRQSTAAKERRRQKALVLVGQHLDAHPCVDCGESDTRVLEFDHLGPKRGNISELAGNGLSVTALRKEISTCEVVCANCHRKRTASRNGSWRGRPETIERKGSTLQGRTKARAYVRDVLLDSACADCGISDLVVLEFDHIGPKRANVSDLVREGYGTARIQAEIDRCEVRCANCHRRRTRAIGTRKAR